MKNELQCVKISGRHPGSVDYSSTHSDEAGVSVGAAEQEEEPDALRELARRARVIASVLSEPDKTRVLDCATELEALAAEIERHREQRKKP